MYFLYKLIENKWNDLNISIKTMISLFNDPLINKYKTDVSFMFFFYFEDMQIKLNNLYNWKYSKIIRSIPFLYIVQISLKNNWKTSFSVNLLVFLVTMIIYDHFKNLLDNKKLNQKEKKYIGRLLGIEFKKSSKEFKIFWIWYIENYFCSSKVFSNLKR